MTVQTRRDLLPWTAIAEVAGTLRTCFLLPQGTVPPPGCGVRTFSAAVLPQFLLLNLGVSVLRSRAVQSAALTVVDPQAVLAGQLDLLVPFARTLRVLTDAPLRFAPLQQKLLNERGLALSVAPAGAPLPEHGVLLSLSAARVPRLFDGLLITNKNRRLLRGETVAGKDVVLPPKIEALRPPGIDRVQFASALFERCGVRALGTLRFCR